MRVWLSTVQTITDADGEVVEVLNAGYISMRGPRPTFPPLVKRRTVYQDVGKPLLITCPHQGNGDGLRWQNKTTRMDPLVLSADINSRVKLDVLNRIIITKTMYADTGHYNCWLKDRHIATISVHIVKSFETTSWKVKIVTYGVYATIIALTVAWIKMYFAQRKNRGAFR